MGHTLRTTRTHAMTQAFILCHQNSWADSMAMSKDQRRTLQQCALHRSMEMAMATCRRCHMDRDRDMVRRTIHTTPIQVDHRQLQKA